MNFRAFWGYHRVGTAADLAGKTRLFQRLTQFIATVAACN